MCKNGPTVVVNITRQLSNYAGKTFIFSKNSRYSPQFFKVCFVGGVCLSSKTKCDDGRTPPMNIVREHTSSAWLLQLKVSLISVGWPYAVITERRGSRGKQFSIPTEA